MNPVIIIPARISSSRLPEKPLADLEGKPMVVRVLECGLEADIGPVIVACDDLRIAEAVREAGGEACMTDPALPSGSDRVYAALSLIDPEGRYDVVINLQGDSPATQPALIQALLTALQQSDFDISTLAVEKTDRAEAHNPNVCKIALGGSEQDQVRRALYFSRSLIPSGADVFYYHIGIYAYRRFALKRFCESPVSSLEMSERLEQLRALEIGLHVGVKLVNSTLQEVNTPEDLEKARIYFKSHSF